MKYRIQYQWRFQAEALARLVTVSSNSRKFIILGLTMNPTGKKRS
jgi:hypothetical protein